MKDDEIVIRETIFHSLYYSATLNVDPSNMFLDTYFMPKYASNPVHCELELKILATVLAMYEMRCTVLVYTVMTASVPTSRV